MPLALRKHRQVAILKVLHESLCGKYDEATPFRRASRLLIVESSGDAIAAHPVGLSGCKAGRSDRFLHCASQKDNR